MSRARYPNRVSILSKQEVPMPELVWRIDSDPRGRYHDVEVYELVNPDKYWYLGSFSLAEVPGVYGRIAQAVRRWYEEYRHVP
jgi:hypothetical protein